MVGWSWRWWSAEGHTAWCGLWTMVMAWCASLAHSFIIGRVEAFVAGWSLVQRSPTECLNRSKKPAMCEVTKVLTGSVGIWRKEGNIGIVKYVECLYWLDVAYWFLAKEFIQFHYKFITVFREFNGMYIRNIRPKNIITVHCLSVSVFWSYFRYNLESDSITILYYLYVLSGIFHPSIQWRYSPNQALASSIEVP
jgi:hypothetical protein